MKIRAVVELQQVKPNSLGALNPIIVTQLGREDNSPFMPFNLYYLEWDDFTSEEPHAMIEVFRGRLEDVQPDARLLSLQVYTELHPEVTV